MRKIVVVLALAAVAVGMYRIRNRRLALQPVFLPKEEEPMGELSTLHAGIATET